MRIFYASDKTPNSAFESNLWYNNLYLPLIDLGHDVISFNYDLRGTFRNLASEEFINKNRPKLTEELLMQIKAAHLFKPVDMFFSYFYDACVVPEAIDEIRAMGITTVNWYCNGSYQLDLVSNISPHYDWCLVPEKFRLDDYISMGARPIYCQEAANPNIYRHYDLPLDFDVTFVGQAYGERPNYIKYILDKGIDVRVWGYGWEQYCPELQVINRPYPLTRASSIGKQLLTIEGWRKAASRIKSKINPSLSKDLPIHNTQEIIKLPSNIIGGVLSDLDMIKMYSRSKINLGFSTCGNTHKNGNKIVQVRLRDFEVLMSGGFYMVEYMEELEEFYDIGEEVVCYHGPEDMAEKINYYLKNNGEREKIRQKGYERCQRDHTWHKRLKTAFMQMGIAKK